VGLVSKKKGSIPEAPSPLMPKLNPLSDPRIRTLVRRALVEGDYEAVKETYAVAKSLVPEGTDLWSWWLEGVEGLAHVGDQDGALFVKFTREVAGIKPWGELPLGGRDRLAEVG
jgi:hypothetical protein